MNIYIVNIKKQSPETINMGARDKKKVIPKHKNQNLKNCIIIPI